MSAGFPLPDVTFAPTRPYFQAAARGELAIPRCEACGRYAWYPPTACPACGGALVWATVSGRGRLFSWAVVRRALVPAFQADVPFATGLVALEEEPAVRVVARLLDCGADFEALRAELPMEACFRPLRFPDVEGEVVVPWFRPLRTEDPT